MHLRDRKLKTCKKLACLQTMGSGVVRALRASPFTSTYHQRTEFNSIQFLYSRLNSRPIICIQVVHNNLRSIYVD